MAAPFTVGQTHGVFRLHVLMALEGLLDHGSPGPLGG